MSCVSAAAETESDLRQPSRLVSDLVLEPLGLRHRAPMQRLVADPQVCGPLGYPCPFPATEAARIVSRFIDGRRAGRVFAFAIIADGQFVGACTLRKPEPGAREADLGFWIGRACWGAGHASRALSTLLGAWFADGALTRVTARSLASNHAAHRVLGKLGFASAVAHDGDPQVRAFELMRGHWSGLTAPASDTGACPVHRPQARQASQCWQA